MATKLNKNMINQQINSINHAPNVIRYTKNIDINKNKYKVELVTEASNIRNQVERFTYDSYVKHFDAHLTAFFPIILTVIRVSDNKIISALGLRYADIDSLFSECYLAEPIEKLIIHNNQHKIDRKRIIELGNFVVSKNSDVNRVMPIISKYIKSLDVEWAIYTLTKPIKSFFDAFNVELCLLGQANKEAVNGAANDWGKYYDFKPAVYYSNVKNNMNEA